MGKMDATTWLSAFLLMVTALSKVECLRCYDCQPGHPCCVQTCPPGYDACGTIRIYYEAFGRTLQKKQCILRSGCDDRFPGSVLGLTTQTETECCYLDDCNAPDDQPQPSPVVCKTGLQCYSCLPNKPCHLVGCPIQYDTCITISSVDHRWTLNRCGSRGPVCGGKMSVRGRWAHFECCDSNGCNLEHKTDYPLDDEMEKMFHGALVHPAYNISRNTAYNGDSWVHPIHHVAYNISQNAHTDFYTGVSPYVIFVIVVVILAILACMWIVCIRLNA